MHLCARSWILTLILSTLQPCGGATADSSRTERGRQSARALASIALVAPADLAVVETTFTIDFKVHGADQLQAGSYAAVLLNNNHGANFTINTSMPVYAASLGLRDMTQMVYDITVALIGPSGKYAGVYNISTVGVIRSGSPPDAAAGDSTGAHEDGKANKWTAEEIHERLKRRKMVDEEMLEHAQSIADLIPAEHEQSEGAVEDAAECGVPAGDVAVGAVAALLQMWEGAEPRAHCFPSAVRDYMLSLDDSMPADTLGSFPTAADLARALRDDVDVEGSSSSTLEEVQALHTQLFDRMRAAAPHDPAMGMEGNSGQLETQRQVYGALSLSRSIASVCETGFGAGHSALNWLAGHPMRRIHSFDLGSLGGAKVGEEFVNTVFPERLSLTFGDSSWTVPEYVSEHKALVCDLLHIDGGHFDFTPWNDLVELARASHGKTVVVVDDTPSIGDVARAMRVAVSAGLLREVGCWGSIDLDGNTKSHHLRGFCIFVFPTHALRAFQAVDG